MRKLANLGLVLATWIFCSHAMAADIVIGQSAPTSGVLGSTGAEMVLGVKICIDAVNAEGGVNGRKLRHVVKDDAYETAQTVANTRDLIEKNHAVALIGYAGTGNIGAVIKEGLLNDNKVPLIAPLTGGESLRKPFNPYVFHIRAGYGDEINRMVDQYVNMGVSRFAIFYQNDALGQAGLEGLQAALERHQLKLAGQASYEKNTENVSAAVQQLDQANPQVVVMVAVLRPAAAFVRAFRQLKPAAQIFGLSIINGADLYALVGASVAAGVGITQVVPSPQRVNVKIVRDYLGALQKYAPAAKPSYTSLEEYIGARVLVEGLRRVKGEVSGEAVRRTLESIDGSVQGYKVSFSSDNHVGSHYVGVSLIRADGRVTD
jgi:ABC-type branched-subunit amino acid transport system substrate-binding protein